MEPHLGGELKRLAGSRLLRSQPDGRLVELTRAGHHEAFEAIVARYRRQLLRYCQHFLPADQAEDTVQEALTQAYTGLLRSRDRDIDLRPWLYRIAHNAAVTALRQRAPRHELLSDDHDGSESAAQALERSERLRDVLSSVNALPEQQRSAILLRALEGRSYDDIATELGLTRGAVHQLVHRARLKLRAAALALVPPGLVSRLPWSGDETAAGRAAELGAAGGTTAVVAKVCATALVTAAVVGGAVGGAVNGYPLGGQDGSGVARGDQGGSGLEAGVVPGPSLLARPAGEGSGRASGSANDGSARSRGGDASPQRSEAGTSGDSGSGGSASRDGSGTERSPSSTSTSGAAGSNPADGSGSGGGPSVTSSGSGGSGSGSSGSGSGGSGSAVGGHPRSDSDDGLDERDDELDDDEVELDDDDAEDDADDDD